LLAGDARRRVCLYCACFCFNPRPPLLAGDARLSAPLRLTNLCFNPRPPLLAGDAAVIRSFCWFDVVSIRARHCWRAMQHLARWTVPRCLFQSAPAIAGGRCPL